MHSSDGLHILFTCERSQENEIVGKPIGGSGVADRLETLILLLGEVNKAMFRQVRGFVHESKFSKPAMSIVGHIMHDPGTTVSELSRRTGVAKSHVSKTVESLAEAGFIEKRPDPADQRLVRLYVGERAGEHFREMEAAIKQHLSNALARLPEQSVEAIIDGLQSLKAALLQDEPPQPGAESDQDSGSRTRTTGDDLK